MIESKIAYSPDGLQERLTTAIAEAQDWLLGRQASDGHWCAELEGDTILESEYLLYLHYIGKLDPVTLRKAANYIRGKILPEGGVAIYPGGPFEISASVKAYMALKWAGDSPDAPHMAKTRTLIRNSGGVTKCNTFSKIYLAMIGLYPWDGCPAIPPELF